MAFTPRAFVGSSFFHDIRAQMDSVAALFAGSDGAFRYVCMDASFYQFEAFGRTESSTFVADALAKTSDVRVVTNAQVFGTSKLQYVPCEPLAGGGPCWIPWQGEIVVSHTVYPGDPPSRPAYRHFGQCDGRTEDAFKTGRGDPSTVGSPTVFNDAVGTLLPLIELRAMAASGLLGDWLQRPPDDGKMIWGIHREANIVFVLAQAHRTGTGSDIKSIQYLLHGMGVDEAVLLDGSSSTTLVHDGLVELTPRAYKNNSIPCGGLFRLTELTLAPGSTLSNTALTTDPNFQSSLTVTGVSGVLRAATPGSELQLTSLGGNATWPELATALGVPMPLTLHSSTSSPRDGLALVGSNSVAGIRLEGDAVLPGSLRGTFSVTTSRGDVVMDANWPLNA